MRAELAEAAALALAAVDGSRLAEAINDEDRDHLIRLATLAVRARSAVERDPRTREIDLIPDSEAPGRLALILLRLLKALRALGADDDDAWAVVEKSALDCVPAIRRRVAEALLDVDEKATAQLATEVDYPTSTTRRALEDLTAHGLAKRRKQHVKTEKGTGTVIDYWRLTDFTLSRWPQRFPEKSVHKQRSKDKEEEETLLPTDISGICSRCGGELEAARGDPGCYGCSIDDPFCPVCNQHANYEHGAGQEEIEFAGTVGWPPGPPGSGKVPGPEGKIKSRIVKQPFGAPDGVVWGR
jgi:hypothetical protein